MADWRWSAPTHNYRDLDTGRFVSGAQVHSWSAAASKASGDAVGTMADMLSEGKLSVRDWTLLMRDEIKDAYIQQYLLGRGGTGKFTKAEAGSLGGMLTEQYRYLDRFAREIADGNLTPGQIAKRARMYAASSKEAFERAQQRAMVEGGMTEKRWRMTPAEHCPDCIAFSGLGWVPIDEDAYNGATPGSGATQCLTNCACEMDYR
jgi:hypothetical protein